MANDQKTEKTGSTWVLDVAQLARIGLNSATEEKKFADQLGAVLDNFELLNKVGTDSVDPTAQATGLSNIFRDDEIKNSQGKESRDELLSNAAEVENGSIKVPSVFDASE